MCGWVCGGMSFVWGVRGISVICVCVCGWVCVREEWICVYVICVCVWLGICALYAACMRVGGV